MGVVMAATRLSADHHILKYNITSTGGAGTINIDAAGAVTPDLITDTILGSPLRNRLSAVVGNQAAGQTLAFSSADVEVYELQRTAAANWLVQANTDGAGHLRLTATSAAADTVGLLLTIVYRHSTIR